MGQLKVERYDTPCEVCGAVDVLAERCSPAVRMVNGALVDYRALVAGAFGVKEIAHHLGWICRYNAATPVYYPVAVHGVLVSNILELRFPRNPLLWFLGLHHDDAEAVMGDMVAPHKRWTPWGIRYSPVEDRVLRHIWEVELEQEPWTEGMWREVAEADRLALLWECRQLPLPMDEANEPMSHRVERALEADDWWQIMMLELRGDNALAVGRHEYLARHEELVAKL